MAHYIGRDPTRLQRLGFWAARLSGKTLQDLSDDDVHAALETLAQQHARFFAGMDADDKPIYRAKREPLAPATINRYSASLAAVITWAIKRRIAPKGYVHPCRGVDRRPEHNERTRFLSDEECTRLLSACRGSWLNHGRWMDEQLDVGRKPACRALCLGDRSPMDPPAQKRRGLC